MAEGHKEPGHIAHGRPQPARIVMFRQHGITRVPAPKSIGRIGTLPPPAFAQSVIIVGDNRCFAREVAVYAFKLITKPIGVCGGIALSAYVGTSRRQAPPRIIAKIGCNTGQGHGAHLICRTIGEGHGMGQIDAAACHSEIVELKGHNTTHAKAQPACSGAQCGIPFREPFEFFAPLARKENH